MSPAEAALTYGDEPDWQFRFLEICEAFKRAPHKCAWPDYMIQDEAFEQLMTEWRRFHFEWRGDGRFKAPQADAVIALAKLGIMPPRSLDPDPENPDLSKLPQPGSLKDLQHDAHCWVNFEASAWKVRAIEDGILHLWHGWRPKVEIWSIDLNQYTPAQWARYCEKAAAMLG